MTVKGVSLCEAPFHQKKKEGADAMKKIIKFKKLEKETVDKIHMFDNFMQLFFPIESEDERIQKEWEAFRIHIENRVQKIFPDLYDKCRIYIETDLCILNKRDFYRNYKSRCIIQFQAQVVGEDGEIIYEDISNELDIYLSEELKKELKKSIITTIDNCLF